MRNLEKTFENRKILYDVLIAYGFQKKGTDYFYEKNISNGHFKVVVQISFESQCSKLIDLSTGEEYVLVDVTDASGNFVGTLKEEYERVLYDIIEKCSSLDVFQSHQAQEVIRYIQEKYHDDLEYLWKKFPKNAIWRNQHNQKWYGALLVLSERKLGIDSDRMVEIIDLRYQKDQIRYIFDQKTVFEGYHMNKEHWITMKLDGSVPIQKIYQLIDNSYQLSLEK